MKHQTHPGTSARKSAAGAAPNQKAGEETATEKQAKLQASGTDAYITAPLPTEGFSARYIDSRLKQFCLR
jgi:hypothetical protein